MNAIETVNQTEINMSSKMVNSLFKLGRYNRVFLEIWAQIPISAPMLKRWAVVSFFLWKCSRRAHRDPQKFFFFMKTSKWEKWWSWWLRMNNAFILCNLLWKVQKSLAVNREGSFNFPLVHWLYLAFFSIILDRVLWSRDHSFTVYILLLFDFQVWELPGFPLRFIYWFCPPVEHIELQ